jgi:hypothetical protein
MAGNAGSRSGKYRFPTGSYLVPQWEKKRQFPRFRVDLKVEVLRAKENTPYRGHVRDLGEGGLGAYVVADLVIGETVILEFAGSPLLRPIRVEAAVRGRTGYRCGFEFLSLSREQRAMIHAAGLFLPSAA